MSEDLLTRAREIPRGIGGHYYNIVQEMADEIERLRRNTGCARNQRSTQFCAEAVDAQREVERIRADREKCHDIMESQSHQLARMARDIEMFREMIAEMRERNNKLLHKLQEFEAREAE